MNDNRSLGTTTIQNKDYKIYKYDVVRVFYNTNV